ncbi:unnamed protein product [Bathycoccus prasinos]
MSLVDSRRLDEQRGSEQKRIQKPSILPRDRQLCTKSSPLKYNLAPPGGSHAIGVRRLMDSAMAVTTVLGELTEPSSLMVVEHCEVLPLADEPSIHFSIMYAITLSRSVGLSL